MNNELAPVGAISHAAFHTFLVQQPWHYWAVDTADLEPLVAYLPVSTTRFVRVLKSHYTYSDLYVFNHTSTTEQIAAIDWQRIPSIDTATLSQYVIARANGQPFLGIAGSYDTAQQGKVVIIVPAQDETPLAHWKSTE